MADWLWYEIALAIFGLILLFLITGIPVAVALGFVGILSAYLFLGRMGVVEYAAWQMSSSFVLGAIPLFIFMGQLLLHGGVSQRLYEGSTALTGKTKGGLLQTNIIACAIFAAISGSSVATSATIGAMAIPEMEKRKYDRRLTLGSLAAGGTLGILIPPSTALIIYGVIVEESIGDLFVAGVLPGIMLSFLYMCYIWTRVLFRPGLAPSFVAMEAKERFKKVLLMWPVLLIIGVILFGIYFGIMTPAEAAAIGASMALGFTIAYGKLTWQVLKDSLIGTVKTTSMLIFIMVSASIIGGTLALLRIPDLLAEWVISLSVYPVLILVIIYIMYIVLGCFIDAVSMIVMTLPIVFPIVVSLGYDPVWFGIIVVILVEIAMITPPIGLNVYTIHGLRPDQPLSDVVLGSMPFMLIMVLALALLTAFPDIATWLPSTMRK